MFSKSSFLSVLVGAVVVAVAAGACLPSFEYQDAGGLCQPCYYRCLSCQDASENCVSCNQEFYLDVMSGTCLSCMKGCRTCSNSTDCLLCNDGFFINANGTCEVCAVGAATCTISITSHCQSTYYMLAGICARCLTNCSSCTGPTTCDECLQGFYLANSTTCTACGALCISCNSSSSCQSCKVGYAPVNGSNGCSACSGVGNVIYSVASATCITCPSNCESCDSQICYYCSAGFYLSNDSTTCISGGSILCSQSNGPRYTQCKVDMYGCRSYSYQQYDTSSGTAVPVDVCLPRAFTSTSQFNYQSNYKAVCTSNITSFTFSSNAFYSLRVYAQLFMFSPLPASIVMNVGNTSTVLTVPSSVSSASLTASACGSYAIWNIDATVSSYDRTVAFTSSGVYLNQILVESLLCSVTNCETCSTNVDCLSCVSPYYLQFNQCLQQCDPGLYQYSTNKTCHIECPDTTYPIASQYLCQDCTGNCLNCANVSACLSCKSGYFLLQTTCVVNCTLSSNSLRFADTTASLCRSCQFPCVSCASNTTTTYTFCLSCAVGYLYNGNCPLNCPIGTFTNYTDSQSVGCSPCNGLSPYFCNSCTNESTCTSCQPNYVLLGSQCLTACPSGYFNNTNVCTQCFLPCLQCTLTAYNCTACKLGVLEIISSVGYCPTGCPNGFHVNFTNNLNVTCSACDSACTLCFGPTSSNCLSCASGYFLEATVCSANCSANTTFKDSSTNNCSACILPCLTCQTSNGSACTSCVVGFLDVPSCTLSCNQTYYPQLSGQLYACTLCPVKCSRCYSDLNGVLCTACNSPYLLFSPNGTCIQAVDCPSGYYNDTINLKCLPCIDPCLTCYNSGVKCLSCTSTTFLVDGLDYCVKQCPSGYYLSGTICYRCSDPCLECYTTATNCTKCGIYNQSQYFLYSNACLLTCPSLYYNDASSSSCKACVDPCLQCYTQFYCKSCSNTSLSLFNKACVTACPTGTLSVVAGNGTKLCDVCTSNCYSCQVSVNNCTTCNSNYFFYRNSTSGLNQCLGVCPNGLYGDLYTSLCQTCVSPCLTCGSYSSCQSCVSGYNLFGTTCLVQCPSQYYALNQICLLCQSPCERCSNITSCTLCVVGLFMSSSSICVSSCATGQYPDVYTRSCIACTYPCVNCSDANTCFNCSHGTSLHLSSCLSLCPNGFFSNSSVCVACPQGCSVCNSSTYCSKCISIYVLSGNLCYQSCPASTFQTINLVENTKICSNCSANCLACTSAYNCSLCQNLYYLQQGRCTTNCSNFYFLSPPIGCMKCSTNCLRCVNASYCLQCFSSFMYNNSCVLSCPVSAYPDLSSMTCQNCISPCLTCSSPYTCLSCIANYYLYQSACIDKCTNQTWTMVDTRTCVNQCPLWKYYELKYCYSQCPITMVGESDVCLDACGSGKFVSKERTCTQCTGIICNNPFQADMRIVQTNPLTIVIYFNQKAELVNSNQIIVTSGSTVSVSRRLLADLSSPTVTSIDSRSIRLTYQDIDMLDTATIYLKLPYVASLESNQSLFRNSFNQTVLSYRRWAQQLDLTIVSNVISFVTLGVVLVNLWSASGHYQHIMDLTQIFFVLSYLEIECPLTLKSFYQGFRPSALGLRLNVAAPQIFSFSPSKFIEFDEDTNLLRSCGLTLILGVVVGLLFLITAVVVRVKKDTSDEAANKLLLLLRKFHKRMFFRYINDYLFIGMIWTGMFAVATFRNAPNTYTIGTYIVSIVALLTIICLIAYIFFVVLSALQKKKPNFSEIEGLVEDLETDCSTLGLMHTPIIYLRKLMIIFLIGLYSMQPVYSLALLLIMSILVMVILIFYKPFKDDVTDYICIAIEAVVVLTLTVLVLLQTNQNALSDSAKEIVAWLLIGVDAAMVAVAIGWWGWRTLKTELLTMCCLKKLESNTQESAAKQPTKRGDQGHNQQQPTAIHLNKIKAELEGSVKPEDVRQALMDEIRGFSNPQERVEEDRISDLSQKEEFVHWSPDQQSDNASEVQQPLPGFLLRQAMDSEPAET